MSANETTTDKAGVDDTYPAGGANGLAQRLQKGQSSDVDVVSPWRASPAVWFSSLSLLPSSGEATVDGEVMTPG